MSNNPDQRPISPYMIGPYYRPQLTSMLSIFSRLAGIFMTVFTLPAMFLYLLALAAGPDSFAMATGLLLSWPGIVLCYLSLFFICYHLANGIRHLIWDTGKMMDLAHVYQSGYAMVVIALLLFVGLIVSTAI